MYCIMMLYFLLQEHSDDKYRLLSLIGSISMSDSEHNIIVACTEETENYIHDFKYIKANVRFHRISNKLGLHAYANNFISVIRKELELGNDLLFCDKHLTFINKLEIPDSVKAQGIGFIKKNYKAMKGNEHTIYSFQLLYISSIDVINKIEKHYQNTTKLFVDGKCEWSKSENDELINAWATLPLQFANYDDGVICVSEYIDCKEILSTDNFFAFEDSWELKNISVSDGLKYKGTDISVVSIRLDIGLGYQQIQAVNQKLLSLVMQGCPNHIAIFNIKYSLDGKLIINSPHKEGLAHWNRTNSHFYNFIDQLAETERFKISQANSDFFSCNNNILLDMVGEKWITNAMKGCFNVLTFDTDEKFTEVIQENGIKCTFIGYVPFDRKIMEEIDTIPFYDRTYQENNPANVNEFSNDSADQESYKDFIMKLADHTHAYINKDTPKSRIVECAYLGVIPIISNDVLLEGLPDLHENSLESSTAMINCYREQFSISAIVDKIMYNIFS